VNQLLQTLAAADHQQQLRLAAADQENVITAAQTNLAAADHQQQLTLAAADHQQQLTLAAADQENVITAAIVEEAAAPPVHKVKIEVVPAEVVANLKK
jgi:hypothetical protein